MIKPVTLTHPVPQTGEPGAFGAIRKFDIHTGIDLYCYEGTSVYAIEDGVVVAIEDFTGPEAGSPWWNSTRAILVEGASGVICYGEVELIEYITEWSEVSGHILSDDTLKVGDRVFANDAIATVKRVLKKDKGVTPVNMLHFELYKPGTTKTVWWHHGEAQPETLLDPTELVRKLYE